MISTRGRDGPQAALVVAGCLGSWMAEPQRTAQRSTPLQSPDSRRGHVDASRRAFTLPLNVSLMSVTADRSTLGLKAAGKASSHSVNGETLM